jgi:hypothetical protein
LKTKKGYISYTIKQSLPGLRKKRDVFSSFDERDRFPLNLKGLSCWPGNSGGVALELKGLSLLSRTGR